MNHPRKHKWKPKYPKGEDVVSHEIRKILMANITLDILSKMMRELIGKANAEVRRISNVSPQEFTHKSITFTYYLN